MRRKKIADPDLAVVVAQAQVGQREAGVLHEGLAVPGQVELRVAGRAPVQDKEVGQAVRPLELIDDPATRSDCSEEGHGIESRLRGKKLNALLDAVFFRTIVRD